MSRVTRIATVAVVATSALGAATALTLSRGAVRRLPAAVGKSLGRSVRVDHVGIGWWRGLAVRLAAVRLAELPAFDEGEPFLAADGIAMRLALGRLLAGRVTVDRVAVEHPILRVSRNAAGLLNLATLGRTRKKAAPAGGNGGGGPRADRPRGRFRLEALSVRDGVVVFHDQPSGRVLALTDVSADADGPRFGVPVPLVLRARLDDHGVSADAIETRGRVTLAGPESVYDGTVVAGPGRVARLPYATLESDIHAEPRALVFDPATLNLAAGAVRGSLRLDGHAAAPLQASFEGQGLDLARLTAHGADDLDPQAEGALTLDIELSGPVGGPRFLDAVTGTLRAEVSQGRLGAFALGSALRDVLAPVAAGEHGHRLRQRFPGLFGDDGVRFTHGSASGQLADGRFRTDDLVVDGTDWDARGTGVFGLDGRLDLALRVTVSPAVADAILGSSRARPILVDSRGALTVPLRLRGRLQRPRVVIDPSFAPVLAKAAVAHAGYAQHPFGDTLSSVLERVLGARSRRR